ncbi:LysR family transcriptional regulator [Nocardioides sp. Y6]|uniref:LysR family transcriptional regulator n=1 Tax=Nocardioides malaquae TaxID=2773426 RepID=A0ABR9RSR9_9ACTN|nr:LysR substrate-binding domain-containing protein [Nocardioides malaquae]MBE7324425.1 LysR family transcriptional regulator [Nocardioides malaquae]
MTLRIAFVPGATPDKWARHWRERFREPLELLPVEEADVRALLEDGGVDMAVARLPVPGAGEDLHCVHLYEELPVVVVPTEHVVAGFDEVSAADLADEQFPLGVPSGVPSRMDQLPFGPMTVKDAIEVAASGTGVVVVPMSVARLHHRKDVTHAVVTDLPTTQMALLWPKDRDDERTQAFVGVVRGRTARSSR